MTQFRPPLRAIKADWRYSYGFYQPEPEAGGGEHRWAAQHAVDVFPTPKPWMALTVWVNHADIASKPVDVKVWRDRALVLQTRLTTTQPVTQYVRVPGHDTRVELETWVSRVLHPRDFGVADARDLGLLVKWTFVDAPPPGASIARARSSGA